MTNVIDSLTDGGISDDGVLKVGDGTLINAQQNLLSSDDIVKQVIEYRKQENLQLKGIAASNIRRQIKRLRDLYLVEKITNNYRITELAKLHDTFEEKVEKFMLVSMMSRVKEYMRAVDSEFS